MKQHYFDSPIAYRIVESFFRHRRLFWAAVIGVTGCTILALALRPQTYTATALTRVVTEDVADALGEVRMVNNWVSPAQQNINQFNDLINDDRPGGFLPAVLQIANLSHPINPDPAANDPRYAALRKAISVSVNSDAVFQISMEWDDLGECQRIVTALQEQHIAEVVRSRHAQSAATATFLSQEIASYKKRMRDAEQALIAYKQNNAGQLPEAQSAEINQLSALRTQLDNLEITSRDNGLKQQALKQRLSQLKPVSVVEQTVGNSPTVNLIQQLEGKRTLLLADGLEPTHPQVQNVTDQIRALRARARSEAAATAASSGQSVLQSKLQENPEYQKLSQQLTETNIAQQTQLAQMQLLRQQIRQYEQRVRRMPIAQRELADKTRDYSILKAQYEALLERREQTQLKINLAKVTAASTLVPVGQVFARPTTGRGMMVLLVVGSTIVGMALGLGMIVLAEWGDSTLRDTAEAENWLGYPVLVAVPEMSAAQSRPLLLSGSSTGGGSGGRPPYTLVSLGVRSLAPPKSASALSSAVSATSADTSRS